VILDLIVQAPSVADLSNEDLTAQILKALGTKSKAEILAEVTDLVANEVRLRRRAETRAIEQGGTPADSTKARRDILSESFFVSPERGYVTWGEATIDDHLTRAAYLRHLVSGTLATADKHERTAKLLRSKGAKCLLDLGQVAA